MDCEDTLPCRDGAGGLRIAVKLAPKAGKTAIKGIERDADGKPHLKVSVTAPAEGGKANAALIAFLAKTWRVSKSLLAVVRGETARMKELSFSGDPEPVKAWIRESMAKQQ